MNDVEAYFKFKLKCQVQVSNLQFGFAKL